MLAFAPRLHVLATSRAALNISGEHVLSVPPLPLPTLDPLPPLDELAEQPAVALLLARAQAANANFQLNAANAAAIAAICVRLDGLPLAIELAAARLKLLAPRALLKRLDRRLALLTSGPRDFPDRHQTLRATIEWSERLLDVGERLLFERLAVFAGGWNLEAAEAVSMAAGGLTVEVLDGLHALLDKHLITQASGADDDMRFGMLETVREYAADRLWARGTGDTLARAHALYYCELAERAADFLNGPEQDAWLVRLDEDDANLRLALDWAAAAGERDLGLRLAGVLRAFWRMRGRLGEGRRLAERALAIERNTAEVHALDAASAWLARALDSAADMAFMQGDYVAARSAFESSAASWRELGRERELGLTVIQLSTAMMFLGEPQAGGLFEEAAALIERCGDLEGLVLVNYSRARDELYRGDAQAARAKYETALQTARRLGNSWWIRVLMLELGPVMLALGDVAAAGAQLEEGLALALAAKDQVATALALNNLGEVARVQGDYARAGAYYAESLTRLRDMGDRADVPRLLHNLGYVALHDGDPVHASALFRDSLERFLAQHNDRGVAEALAGFASVVAAEQQPDRAARLWGAAEALRQTCGAELWPADLVEYVRHLARARAASSAAAFESAWAAGRALTSQQAVSTALAAPLRNSR